MATKQQQRAKPQPKAASAPPQSGTSGPHTSKPHWERSGAWNNKPLPREMGAEWPNTPLDENYSLLVSGNPSKLLPERFTNARNIAWGSPLSGEIEPPSGQPNFETYGGYVGNFDPSDPERRGIWITKPAKDAMAIYTHELGHDVWSRDLQPTEQQQWEAEHGRTMQQLRELAAKNGITPQTPNLKQRLTALPGRQTPLAVLAHPTDPGHSFAELFGQYMANPTAFKQTYPETYGFFVRLLGKEYIQSPQQQQQPAPKKPQAPTQKQK